MEEEIAIKALKEVKTILDRHEIKFWLDMGTLLGAVRDGKFISWDGDIDLGTFDKENHKFSGLINDLIDNGYEVFCRLGQISIIKYKKSKISIHIYNFDQIKFAKENFYVHYNERFYNGNMIIKRKKLIQLRIILNYLLWFLSAPRLYGNSPYFIPNSIFISLIYISNIIPNCIRKLLRNILIKIFKKLGFKYFKIKVPINFFRNLSNINFYGMDFHIPNSVDEYLHFRYGSNWRIPKKDYIYYKEDGAIIQN